MLQFKGVAESDLSLSLCLDASLYSEYIAFKQKSCCARSLSKLISANAWVVCYITATSRVVSQQKQSRQIGGWLNRLGCQLRAGLPKSVKPSPTDWKQLSAWATYLAKKALAGAEVDMRLSHELSHDTARDLQFAIIANLLVGTTVPPIRVFIIRTAQLPLANHTCDDDDCLIGARCLGNRFVFERVVNFNESTQGEWGGTCN